MARNKTPPPGSQADREHDRSHGRGAGRDTDRLELGRKRLQADDQEGEQSQRRLDVEPRPEDWRRGQD